VTREELHIMGKVECANVDFVPPEFNEAIAQKSVTQQALQALEWTGIRYYDVLLLHWPCDGPFENTLARYHEMEAMQRRGIARKLGVSNFNATMLEALMPRVDIKPVVNQAGYSIAGHRSPQWGSDEGTALRSEELGLTYIAYSPMGSATAVDVTNLPEVERVAAARGMSPMQVALRWVLQQGRGFVTSSSSMAHTRADLQVRDLELTSDEMRLLSDIPESCDTRGVFNSCL